MRIGSLFSGIGGLDLGLEWSGLGKVVWQVEHDEFCQHVLRKHWSTPIYKDVRNVGKHNLPRVNCLVGGFPCQDISSAGHGKGLAGSRSGLWTEFARIIHELRPEWVVVENVASGASKWVRQVEANLGQLKYEALAIPLSAADVGATHLRARVFIVANTGRTLMEGQRVPSGVRQRNVDPSLFWSERPDSPFFCGMDHGISQRVDRIKSLGNSVVPQQAEVIGHVVRELIEQQATLVSTDATSTPESD